jgi:hypothetical protein
MRRSFRTPVVFTALSALLAVAASSQADAAETAFVSRIGGKGVTLSKGQETFAVKVQTLLSSGDRVTAAYGSFVEVTYLEDGCILRATNGRSITVSGASPCAAAAKTPEGETEAQLADQRDADADIVPAAAQASSARVTDATGPLARANLGQGLVDLRAGMVLKPGDTVFAGQGSTITLQFPDAGCSYTLPAETYLQVGPSPPCVPSVDLARQDTSSATAPILENVDDAALAIAGLTIVGGGAAVAAILLTGDDDEGDDGDGRSAPVTPN